MNLFRKFFYRNRNDEIRFCGYDGTPYKLADFAPDCYVRQGGHAIGTFETMSVRNSGRILHIDHFAVTSAMQGHGRGEAILRGFALMLMEQRPAINRITFDLGRAREGSDIERLARARAELFTAIGAHDILENRPNNRRICVSAAWDRNRWVGAI